MISRHIHCEPQNDNYRRLAQYIADASHEGEKCLHTWCAGCWSGDDEYQLAIREVEDTQAMNVRTSKEKTYHLMISFRPEDEAKLTPETFKEIERDFANVLGFEEHQRHCGVHRNTDNIHLHIAYSEIHPETKFRHEPYRDYEKRDRLCRALELKYGLTADNGRDPDKEAGAANDVALAYEAHTGQESFFSYTQRHKGDVLTALGQAENWVDCHQAFHQFGLSLTLHGNGLIIQSHDGQHSIKASGFDRSISKPKLEKQFGAFMSVSPKLLKSDNSTDKYSAAPLHKGPDRGMLYDQFKAAMAKRQAALEEIDQQDARLFSICKLGWDKKRAEIKKTPMLRAHRQKVMKELKASENADRFALRKQMKQTRDAVRAQYPFNSWGKFLRHQASQGSETALAILRSKREKAFTEKRLPASDQLSAAPSKATLTSLVKMREIFKLEGLKIEPRYTIDTKGAIIFKLPDGGTVRDTGAEVHCSANNDQAKRIAAKLAQSRWGQSVSIDGNALKSPAHYTPSQQPQTLGRSGGLGR